MVKILENKAVDLDIAPGSKDAGELQDQANAIAYAYPPPCSAILGVQLDGVIADSSSHHLVVKQHRTSLPKPVSESKVSRKALPVLAQMLYRPLVGV